MPAGVGSQRATPAQMSKRASGRAMPAGDGGAHGDSSWGGAAGKENVDSMQIDCGAHAGAAPAPKPQQALSSAQVAELYKNCIRLASENKISQKNTWNLQLIDHLGDLVRPSEADGQGTNFQHASCTLDAGIKIYAYRVDSVHSEAYKVLGGLSRTANPADDGEPGEGGEGEGTEGGGARRRRAAAADADPCSTLESSFEALNVKKFDLAFAVDPLFHKTSAQFDEGGAQGLLLNNLSVYRGCEIVFDSSDVPEEALASATDGPADVQIDLSSLQQQLDVVRSAPAGAEISPALDAISALLGQAASPDAADAAARLVADAAADRTATGLTEAASQPADASVASGSMSEAAALAGEQQQPADMAADFSDDGYDGDMGCGGDSDIGSPSAGAASGRDSWAADGAASGVGDGSSRSPGSGLAGSATSGGLGPQAVQWLMDAGSREGPVTRGAGWAGASHWKYRAEPDPAADKPKPAARAKRKAKTIDFENLPPLPEGALRPAARRDQICLKTLTTKDTLLPEDLHYEPKQLVQLFLKPGMSLARAARGGGGSSRDAGCESDGGGDGFDYGGGSDDDEPQNAWGCLQTDNADELIDAPRKVASTSISYAQASKQVDVAALKKTLWGLLLEHRQQQPEGPLQFQDIISSIDDRSGAGRLSDLSVHLCFICLLHLANEHGLVIRDAADLGSLSIDNIRAQ